ncbi:hypothetical protein PAEPH01_2551 [Pancytospora epiphaga]|nr:hypothetical protein PAEPH01_2551 [Pancytospora epiphaga]
MPDLELLYTDLDKILEDLNIASQNIDKTRSALLKHYLLHYILYINMNDDDKEESPVQEKLTTISILLEKLRTIEKKMEVLSSRRGVDRQMMRNKNDALKAPTVAPIERRKRGAEKLLERTKKKVDPNMDFKKKTRKLE